MGYDILMTGWWIWLSKWRMIDYDSSKVWLIISISRQLLTPTIHNTYYGMSQVFALGAWPRFQRKLIVLLTARYYSILHKTKQCLVSTMKQHRSQEKQWFFSPQCISYLTDGPQASKKTVLPDGSRKIMKSTTWASFAAFYKSLWICLPN